MATIIHNQQTYRDTFIKGLNRLLDSSSLGVFILVLANASYDSSIFSIMKRHLRNRFRELSLASQEKHINNQSTPESPEDLGIFQHLCVLGFDGLQLTKFRKTGPWEVQFNQLRALRPPRMSREQIRTLCVPFDAASFNFNKPYLRKEIIWEGDLLGEHCRLLYNKFPFANLHSLLVVNPSAEKPQFLQPEDHYYIWRLGEEVAHNNPGIGFGYNSYGAFASVNHQHFQMFVRDQNVYPVEEKNWLHNNGETNYPLLCRKYSTPEKAWEYLDMLHKENQYYNLLYRPGILYVLSRARQGSYQRAPWTSGFAWAETMGHITTFTMDDFLRLDTESIEGEFSRMAK